MDSKQIDDISFLEEAAEEIPQPIDSTIIVFVSADKMKASISIAPPENGGNNLTKEGYMSALAEKKVVYGIVTEHIYALESLPNFNTPVEIAFGTAAIPGNSAQIVFKVRKEKVYKPKELENGNVDYKDIGLVENVMKGDILCEKIPATPGTPGTDVYGNTIIPKHGKDANMPMGKNTNISPDKLKLIAQIDGQAEYANNKISVLNTFTVEENVSMATGNIIFVGNIVVKGSVLSGFTVQASGNIDINGNVEAAKIYAGGNIIIRGGFNGMGKGIVQAQGSVVTKFAQAGTVFARENVELGYSYSARIQCGGTLKVLGKKGIIVGGHVIARTAVESAYYGGRNSPIPTVVEVGNDPLVITRSHEIPTEIESCKKNLNNIKRLQSILLQLKAAGRLDEEKAQTLEKTTYTVDHDTIRLADLEEELLSVKQKLAESGFGKIHAQNQIYQGVRLIIGSEILLTQKEYSSCTFSRDETGIIQLPYSATPSKAKK